MGTSPSYFVNSPSAGVQILGKVWAGCVGVNGDSIQATVRTWTGANGTGSLVAVTNLECWVWDFQAATSVGHFGPGNFNTCNAAPSGGGGSLVTGRYYYVAGKFTAGSPGSMEFFVTFGTSGFFWPNPTTFSPGIGGPGTTVTINGTRLFDMGSVLFNGTPDGTFVVNSDTQITAHVPSGATKGKIGLVNPVGEIDTSTDFIPSTVEVDNGTSYSYANAVWGDDGATWQLCKVWVDNGTSWVQIG